jgi:aldose 1-epimerase
MVDEKSQMISTRDQPENNRLYTAEVALDQSLHITTLSLSSTDLDNSSSTIHVCIAPEFGSNLFRFRVGEHDLIYTDPILLSKRDYTGTFVLWPFPNRVRAKRYT